MTGPSKPEFTWAYLKPLLKAKARMDPEFREKLLKDPAGAFKEVVGYDLPAGVTVSAVEETGEDLFVVVPPAHTVPVKKGVRVYDADDWKLIIMDGEDCPGDGNPTDFAPK